MVEDKTRRSVGSFGHSKWVLAYKTLKLKSKFSELSGYENELAKNN
jgi:hypothetical protein